MPSVTALRRWLVFVALLRLLSVYLGVFQYSYFQSHLFDLQPAFGGLLIQMTRFWLDAVNELYGRTFATWTLTTCALCLICAKNPRVRAIYAATLLSFVAALVHFTVEVLVYKTMSLKSAANPLVIAGISTLWMGAGWNYYLNLAAEPEASEDHESESMPAVVKQE